MTTRNDDFQRYDRKLSRSMAMGSLREALLSSDAATIEAAVENCEKLGLGEDPKVEETRNSHLPILVAKKELQIACERRDRDSIEACLEKMAESGVAHSDRLFVELNKARILLDLLSEQQRLQQQHRRHTQALELDRRALSELRRYQKPPQLLHRIVQAALLLLGESEDQTDDWRYCQRLCNPQGRNSLSRRLTQFQPETVHEEIVARVKQILSERDRDGDLDLEKVETIGAGTGLAFYVWTRAAIEKAESARKTAQQKGQRGQQKMKGQLSPAMVQPPIEPANKKRQKELLSRLNASGSTTSNGSSVKMVAPANDRRARTDYRQQRGDRTSELTYSRTPGDGRYRFH